MIIRNVEEKDIKRLWEILKDDISIDSLKELYESSYKMVSDIDSEIGFAAIRKYSQLNNLCKYQVYVYVSTKYRRRGYGSILLAEVEKAITSSHDYIIKIEYNQNSHDTGLFIKNNNYDFWYATHRMYYKGPRFKVPELDLITYEDCYYHKVNNLCAKAFYRTRKDNAIEPFAIPESDQERQAMLASKDSYKLLITNNELIGFVKTTHDYVSILAVSDDYRKQGYGSRLLQHATNSILDNKHELSKLHVMASNQSAKRLYETIGYKNEQTIEVYKKHKGSHLNK